MNSNSSSQISAIDYTVIALILIISFFIGVYHGFREKILAYLFDNKQSEDTIKNGTTNGTNGTNGTKIELHEKEAMIEKNGTENNTRKNEKTSEYLMANSTMGTIPVAFSLFATSYSATVLIGVPAEVYQFGVQFWISAFAHAVCPLIGAFITGPFFANHKVHSIFEYFELRFASRHVRLVGSVCYLIRNSIACAIYMYGPAAPLALLARLDEKLCIGLLGLVGTLYTCIGGIRGVIWNDLFQALIMFTSLIIIMLKGVYDAGGISNLWSTNAAGGRLNFLDFNPDPFVRQTFWSLLIGQLCYMAMPFCFDQQMMQRFQASRTKHHAKRALLLNSPGLFLMITICSFVGLILYANFAGCDPLTDPNPDRRIKNPNQLVGYFIVNNLNMFPGVAGIFLASLFCGSLSSVSTYLNSQSAIIWHDILLPIKYFSRFDDRKSLRTNKIIVLICGIVGTLFSYLISTLGGNLAQISNGLIGAFNAPIMGLFLLGMFFSVSTPRGVITGTVAGFLAALWISLGAYITKPKYPMLGVTTEFCPNVTGFSPVPVKNHSVLMAADLTGINKFYSLSYMLYMPFGILVTIVVGLIASFIDVRLSKTNVFENRARIKEYIYHDLCFLCVRK